MKRLPLFLAIFLFSSVACRRKITQDEVKTRLEKAMSRQLAEQQRSIPSHPHFDVQDVVWFEDSTCYLCEFKVKMTMSDGHDTTGIIKRSVSKDFNSIR